MKPAAFFSRVVSGLLLFGLGTGTIRAAPDISDYVISRWEMKDGLPVNKVRAVVRTRDGYLWLGTLDGQDSGLKAVQKTP